MISNCIDLARGEVCVDGYWPGIECACSQQNRTKSAAIFANNHDSIAGAYAGITQPDCCFGDRRSQLLIRPRAGGFDDRRLIR